MTERKMVSREVYEELRGTPGVYFELEVTYYMTVGKKPKAEKPKVKRSPCQLLRLANGHSDFAHNLSAPIEAAYMTLQKDAKLITGGARQSKAISGTLANKHNAKRNTASYWVGRLVAAGVLEEVHA